VAAGTEAHAAAEVDALWQATTALDRIATAAAAPGRADTVEHLVDAADRTGLVLDALHRRLAELQTGAELAADEDGRRDASLDTEALETGGRLDLEEHGWTAAEHGCAICGWSAADVRIGERVAGWRITASPPYPWEVYRPLRAGEDIDGSREVWVCRDEAACHERYDQARIEGATNAERELLGLAVVLPFRRPAR
jgi:hypothetical protein